LSSIGPDGHIAYNVRGSDLFATTRIAQTNFETQADAASTLGGIEVAKKRLVITIGLETITYNPDCTAIIFAAGEANADIVKETLESKMTSVYPATALQRLPNARFYLTEGAACKLNDSIERYYKSTPWNFKKTEKSIIDLCSKINKYAHHLTLEDLQADPWCSLIPNLSLKNVQETINSVIRKIDKGLIADQNKVIFHIGPHHDDIMLGIMPYANRQLLSTTNDVHYAVATSGYNSVTNHFIIQTLESALKMIDEGLFQMLKYPDFFTEGYKHKRYKDVYHFLDNCALNNEMEKERGLCHRVVRDAVEIWDLHSVDQIQDCFRKTIENLKNSYDGSKNPPEIQRLKGRLREFEEELVWNYNGVKIDHIHHWRLSFYKGGINPDNKEDVETILEQFRKYKPDIISLAFDPEGSGPDTHYKVLQAIAEAVTEWSKEDNISMLRIIGYRNVWFKFQPSEANIFVPVSLNDLAIHAKSFSESYLTQVEASFPSPECDGPFSEISKRIWVKQLKQIQLVLGKNYFYESENALIRSTHGMMYLKEMTVSEFLDIAKELKNRSEGKNIL
jgi:6-phosphogluconolactonase/Glucosamine-6-phosphate isomerase/deaminase